jgi:hypothetical protein
MSQHPDVEKLLTASETCKMIRIGRSELVGYVETAFLAPDRSAGRWLFRIEDVEAVACRRAGLPAKRPSVVYLMQRVDATGPVKIGCSRNARRRCRDLSYAGGHQLVVVTTMAGGPHEERELHKRFAHYRLFGEWFDAAVIDEMWDFIDEPSAV